MDNEMVVSFPGGKRVDAHYNGYHNETDQSPKYGGEGTAPEPYDLFLASMATCAGIYVLGGSTRTALRDNVIHDVNAYQYGGWGIHADEGSANLRIENNVVYNTTSGGFDQYYGNLNYVRNNIFAFSRESQLSLSNINNPVPVMFERNIVVTDNALPFGMNWDVANNWLDYNCYYDVTGAEMDLASSRERSSRTATKSNNFRRSRAATFP